MSHFDDVPQDRRWHMYTPDECKYCGRVRVELIDGKKICEKCHYNQDTEEFESDHREYI
jgi:uncharacterized Zn finger protein (UPF0148 family)